MDSTPLTSSRRLGGLPDNFVPGYTLKEELGRGAVGIVYRAKANETGDDIAIKFLYSDHANSEKAVARLSRESKITATLDHPNVVRSYGSGLIDGVYYILFKYIDGESLDTLLERERRIDERRAARMALQVALGLQAAHKFGVIHRDIKPGNLIISRDEHIHITDFGLAKPEIDTSVTVIGGMLGTPDFISPEQIQTQSELDIRTDLYSLGVTLFLLVTGQSPYAAFNISLLLTKKIIDEVPDPLSLNKNLSEKIVYIIRKLCRRDREKRYRNPAELIQALEAYLQTPIEDLNIPAFSRDENVKNNALIVPPPKNLERERTQILDPEELPAGLHHPILKSLLRKEEAPPEIILLQPEQILFLEDDRSKDAYILLDGQLEILKAGKRISTISQQGDCVGELSCFLDERRTATVRALAQTSLLKINEAKFEQMIDSLPDLAVYLAVTISEKLCATTRELEKTQSVLSAIKRQFNQLPENLDI